MLPTQDPGGISPMIQALLAQLQGAAGNFNPGAAAAGPMGQAMEQFQSLNRPMAGQSEREGQPPAPGNPLGTAPANARVAPPNGQFAWGGRTWGANDFSAFTNYLKGRGVDIAQWARAHPGAFAMFNIDPRIKQVIASGAVPAPGGMAHA